jgi:hypothetical protein
MTELERLASQTPAWTTTADGNALRRAELLDLVVDEVLETYDPLTALLQYIRDDPRKSFSKRTLIELIEERQ